MELLTPAFGLWFWIFIMFIILCVPGAIFLLRYKRKHNPNPVKFWMLVAFVLFVIAIFTLGVVILLFTLALKNIEL
jgi:phosphoglycerol transferase MdoB-like AlkP superfamily enzyme